MPRVTQSRRRLSLLVLGLCIGLGVFFWATNKASAQTTVSQPTQALMSLSESLKDRTKSTKEAWNLKEFPKTLVDGDLYEHAHSMAEYQIAYPASAALDLTIEYLAERCEDRYRLYAADVVNVFAATQPGERLRDLLQARNSLDIGEQFEFDKSCTEVVKCYFRDDFTARWIDAATRNAYTHTTYNTCTTLVSDVFSTMLQRTSGLSSLRNINYGDDLFLNANPKDSFYDLLTDVEHIADLLFIHNDPASEIHFYEGVPTEEYVDNDPDDITEYDLQDPAELDRMDRLPRTNGVTRAVPETVTAVYPAKQAAWDDKTPDVDIPLQPGDGTTAGPIANYLCVDPVPFDPQSESETEYAEEEQDQTIDYNDKLPLDEEVAVALAWKMDPELEELFGLDDAGQTPTRTWAKLQADAILQELVDLKGGTLQQVKEHIEGCIEQFTEKDKGQRRKIVRNSITQPTQFTKCVYDGLCQEFGDESWRGMYRIKICKEPRKGTSVVANQSVKTVEETVDELLNVCYGLKESGQLLESNKTKDHMEHKLMRVKLGDKISFGLSVFFKSPNDKIDPAAAKRLIRENNNHLEKVVLWISDDLTFAHERNKYLVLHNVTTSKSLLENDPVDIAVSKAETQDSTMDLSETAQKRATRSQLQYYGETLDTFADFVQLNIEMRRATNESTNAMKDIRQQTEKKFQNASQNQ